MSVREDHELICPKCRDDDTLHVTFTGECLLTFDGSEDEGDHEWGDNSDMRCDCGWSGKVLEARRAYQYGDAEGFK